MNLLTKKILQLYSISNSTAVQLSNYSIKTYYYAENGGHLKSWSIEVSNDENNWEKVDEHTDDKSLNGSFVVAT